MNYATGHALNTDEIVENFPIKKLSLTTEECKELIGDCHKQKVVAKVFKACVGLVLDDIINNNTTFLLPTRSKKAQIYMKRYVEDDFIKCRQNGKFNDVNFIASNFSGYQLAFKYQSAGVFREKSIYIDSERKNQITKYTNEGKNYF